eukprot:TRINITY_DN18942_c0_g1_i1.p1 TRINITY_DN18942_c0_g1~~TRINITY_DN18942_c0_g1_i1.p1  ORF type:complete len:173 (-),score=36.96 TRINITY_DN18942_c0_g1_i1:42-560(-)
MDIHCPQAFLTVLGHENYDKVVSRSDSDNPTPFISHSDVLPKLHEKPILASKFNIQTQFYGSTLTPWILLPLRRDVNKEIVYPVWFLVNTGAWDSYLHFDTMEFLGVSEGDGLYLLDVKEKAFKFGALKEGYRINVLGRRILLRGKFTIHHTTNLFSFEGFGPNLAPTHEDL